MPTIHCCGVLDPRFRGANSVSTESYVLYGLKAGFDDGGAYSLFVEGRNLEDTH